MIANLQAMTVEHDPARLRQVTTEVTATLLACGVDPDTSLCYLQSVRPGRTELHYLLECVTVRRGRPMIQFRQRSAGSDQVRLSRSPTRC
jgi:tryptophanyl-tRNA synthetase